MRFLIVSDIHSNLEAIEAVLEDAEGRGGFDQIWSLGDIVGYGPNPAECIDLVRRHNSLGVAGNHDLATAGKIDVEYFNSDATAAIAWTACQVTDEHAEYLGGLPLKMEIEGFTLVHGSPREPYWQEYVTSPEIATASFALLNTPKCLLGHSHIAFMCRPENGTACFTRFPVDKPIVLGPERYIVNPGSVGQPRDRDPRASYLIYDSRDGTVSNHRVDYDVKRTQAKMSDMELPLYLIERLPHGL